MFCCDVFGLTSCAVCVEEQDVLFLLGFESIASRIPIDSAAVLHSSRDDRNLD